MVQGVAVHHELAEVDDEVVESSRAIPGKVSSITTAGASLVYTHEMRMV